MKKQINPTIKAHLIRGAFCLLLLITACAIPLALAHRNATNRSVATATTNPNVSLDPAAAQPASADTFPTVSSASTGVAPLGIPPYPQAPQVVLYDQYNNASSVATLSATFTDFPAFNSDLADDFVVPAGQTWNVQSIDADGVYFPNSGPANSFNVFFYANNAGLPGTQVYSAMNQPFSVVGSTFTVNLPSIAVLSAGTYWVEIQANMTFNPNGEWDWRDRTLQSNQGAAWQNPGGGFGACPTWTRKPTCIPSTGGPDQVFRLNGTIQGTSPTPSPTASPTATHAPTATATFTPTATPTVTATATATAAASPTPTPTATASPTVTPTATPTPTGTPVRCVFGQGFWKNHPEQWPVTQLQLGNVTYTEDQLLSILRQPVRRNGLVLLAHQEIAAKLNIANGADGSCIQQTLAAADTLIGNLVVPPIGNGFLAPRDVSALADALEQYNEGMLCAPSCEGSPPPTATPVAARARPTAAPRPH